jgi:hypothetical protein
VVLVVGMVEILLQLRLLVRMVRLVVVKVMVVVELMHTAGLPVKPGPPRLPLS